MVQLRSRLDVRTIAGVLGDILKFAPSILLPRTRLAAENLFLRKQLALYVERGVKPRRANDATRLTLVGLSRLIDWRHVLIVVKPETLIRWHRKGFRLFWRWKSRSHGRPRVPARVQQLIAEMAAANRTWGEERIASELLVKLRIRVSPRTVRRLHALRFPGCWIETSSELSELECLRAESRAVGARLRLFRDGDGRIPKVVRLRGPGRGHAPDPALERH
jgi:hypothetical protein